jgi:hypothetical protein
LGINIDEIESPENTWELEERFWGQVESAITEALRGRESKMLKKNRSGKH